jgi:hypothetical protein
MDSAKISRPIRVGDMLAAAMPGLGERMVEQHIRAGWAKTVGADLARRCRPGGLEAGVLTVVADNSPWLTELRLRAGELLAAVRSRHGGAVTAVRFALGDVAAQRTAAGPRRSPAPGRLSPEEERSLETMTASVADPAIAASLRRLVTKDWIARRHRGMPLPARREDS